MPIEATKSEILFDLKWDEVTIKFRKADGTDREMRCTLNEDLIPQENRETGESKKKSNPYAQPVWDLEKEGWRSFRWDALFEVDGDEVNVSDL